MFWEYLEMSVRQRCTKITLRWHLMKTCIRVNDFRSLDSRAKIYSYFLMTAFNIILYVSKMQCSRSRGIQNRAKKEIKAYHTIISARANFGNAPNLLVARSYHITSDHKTMRASALLLSVRGSILPWKGIMKIKYSRSRFVSSEFPLI